MQRKIILLLILFISIGVFCLLTLIFVNKQETPQNQSVPTNKTASVSQDVNLRKPIPTVLIDQARNKWRDILNQAKQKWLALNISSYDVKVSFENTTWNPIVNYSITVKNHLVSQKTNEVKDPRCCDKGTPYPTLDIFYADQYTIEGLFDLANIQVNTIKNEDSSLSITFDDAYYFPKEIMTGSFTLSDVQKIWKVEEFKGSGN